MSEKEVFSREDLEWALGTSVRMRCVAGASVPLVILIIRLIFGVPFPLLPIFALGLFECFINQPYPFIRRRVKSLNILAYINTSIDVIVITFLIHYAGGIEIPFFTILYLAPIIFATTNISILIGMWLATLSSIAYAGLIGLEYFQRLGHIPTIGIQMSAQQQVISCSVTISLFYVLCYFAYLTSSRLRSRSRELRHRTERLSEVLAAFQQRLEQLVSVSKICREIALSLDINTLLEKLVEQIAKTLKAERISVMLKNEKGCLVIKASKGIPAQIIKRTSMRMGEKISGWVASQQEPLLVENIDEDPRFGARRHEFYYTKSLISCPLVVKDETIGVVNINNKSDHTAFNIYDLEITKALCADMAVAIENARLYSELRQSYINSVKSLVLAVDVRDHYTQGHLRRVSNFVVAIGRQLNLDEYRLENLRIATLLHDIGKIGISDSILLKEGRLTSEEWAKMREHPLVGERILNPLGFPKEVADIVRHHHERYDGKGYPDGISGEDVSLESYILGCADAFDAMMSDRPYRKSLEKEQAMAELRKGRGTQFHPQVVDAFLSVLEKEGLENF